MKKKIVGITLVVFGLILGYLPHITVVEAELPSVCTPTPTEPVTPGGNEAVEIASGLLSCDQGITSTDKFNQQLIDLLNLQTTKIEEAKRIAIDESLKGEMSGQIEYFYDRSIELGLDPVYVVALAAWETGDGTSNICVNKHNFGGMRSGGEWTRFESKEAGIEAFLNLLVSYAEKGSDTPEEMAARYAPGSETWAPNVRKIMKRINDAIEKKQTEVRQEYDLLIENLKK